jgi:hypothetical protein
MNKKNIIEPFDYGTISKEQKKTVEEVINLAQSAGHTLFAELLKNKFQIKERKKFDMKDSIFVKYAIENSINCAGQGYVDNLNYDEKIYPIVAVCEDIRKLDNFILKIQEQALKSKIKD